MPEQRQSRRDPVIPAKFAIEMDDVVNHFLQILHRSQPHRFIASILDRISIAQKHPFLTDMKFRATAATDGNDLQPGIDPFPQFRHVGNDSDHTAALLQVKQRLDRQVQGFRI